MATFVAICVSYSCLCSLVTNTDSIVTRILALFSEKKDYQLLSGLYQDGKIL